jgi:hypothetical protein
LSWITSADHISTQETDRVIGKISATIHGEGRLVCTRHAEGRAILLQVWGKQHGRIRQMAFGLWK